MKHVLIGVILCLSFACSGLAQDTGANAPASKEDVERYLQAVHSQDMMRKMMDAMVKSMQQMTHDRYLKDKDKLPADFEARTNKMMDDMMKNMPFDEMIQAMVPTYQKHFTKGDMDGLLAFYNSPTGQKLLREMPAITAEAMTALMPIMRQHMDVMTRRLQQQTDEMLKKP
ncbi:MAG TPA: DUF2059 domain-containing protein [Verrucomicrobiae bacterium]|nr:DUF2059 domain-containing protein [Verrucomicrobiae bacterium]